MKSFVIRYKKAIIKRLIFIAIITVILLYSYVLKVVNYDIEILPQNERSLKIALITDLHACYYGNNQKWLISELVDESPDLILLGGDIYDDQRPFDNADKLLAQLPSIAPSYYVDGNHENWLSRADYDDIMHRIVKHGVHIIHGRSVSVGGGVVLHGVSDPDGGYYEQDLQQIISTLNPDAVNVLLTHRPERIDEYRQYGFDVILSGHAHGGQWRIPFLINGMYAPSQGILPKYAGGRYDFDDAIFIVSRGLARESTFVPRLFNRPELVFIHLKEVS